MEREPSEGQAKEANRVERRAREWAEVVVEMLPADTMITGDELQILQLFLAQQRRINTELDERDDAGAFQFLRSLLPIRQMDDEERRVAHQLAAQALEGQIEEKCMAFCRRHNLSPEGDAFISWRVAIRYMAQEIYRLTGKTNVRDSYYFQELRLQLWQAIQDRAVEVANRRRAMILLTSVP